MNPRVLAYPIHEIGQRSNQEDSLFPSPKESPSKGLLYILCDGMGGHAAGEIASQTVCKAMSEYILSHPEADGHFDENDFAKALDYTYATLDTKDTDDEKKMGTTLVFAKFHEGGCFVAHIGDSRIYQIRPSARKVLFVSRDHSLVNELIELGEMTPEEAKTSNRKNVITRAMQPHQDCPAKADWVNLTDLKDGDYLYLCSDGMLEQMDDDELVNTLSARTPDSKKVSILKESTKYNRDNHSAWLIRIESTQPDSKKKGKHFFLKLILYLAIIALIIFAASFLHIF